MMKFLTEGAIGTKGVRGFVYADGKEVSGVHILSAMKWRTSTSRKIRQEGSGGYSVEYRFGVGFILDWEELNTGCAGNESCPIDAWRVQP